MPEITANVGKLKHIIQAAMCHECCTRCTDVPDVDCAPAIQRGFGALELMESALADYHAEVELLRNRVQRQSVDRAAALVWNNAENHRDTWAGASDWRWLWGLLEEVAELCLALAGLHRHPMTTRAETIEWELTQIGAIVVNWLRQRDCSSIATEGEKGGVTTWYRHIKG